MQGKMTDCGAANLLAAIFGTSPNNIKRRLGMPVPTCPQCGKSIHLCQKFCSRKCEEASRIIKLSCAECGQLFDISAKNFIWRRNHNWAINGKPQEHWFCCRQCFNRWFGKNSSKYGFGVHPENIRKGVHLKWDYSLVYNLRDKTGWGAPHLSRALGIPLGTISAILRKGIKEGENERVTEKAIK